jgi:septum formation protein
MTDFLVALAPANGAFVYLASQSPRRRELLEQIGIEYRVLDVEVDEAWRPGETPQKYACRLARDKAAAGRDQLVKDELKAAPVLGADTCVVVDDEVLGKPADREHGIGMLSQLAGRTHEVVTGIAIASGPTMYDAVSVSRVRMADLSRRDIEQYWDSGEPEGKAGAYGIQGLAGAFVSHIEGSYSGVVGLPLYELVGLLNQLRSDSGE